MEKEELESVEIILEEGPVKFKKNQIIKVILAPFYSFGTKIKFIGDIQKISIGCYLGKNIDNSTLQIIDIFLEKNTYVQTICLKLKILNDIVLNKKNTFYLWKKHFSLARITLSDKGFLGNREDLSGPLIEQLIKKELPLSLCLSTIIPDDYYILFNLLTDMAFLKKVDMIITTGGTGVTDRDITPDATGKVIERRLWGFEHAIFSEGLKKTKHAMISRAVCGIANKSLIINLPGSKKSVLENLSTLLPALKHTLEKIQNDPKECGI